jgi:hypothetical protein
VDQNTGTIAGTVTYCTNSVCSFAAVGEGAADHLALHPNPVTGGRVRLTGFSPDTRSISLLDATGRPVRTWGPETELDLNGLASGAYRLIASGSGGRRSLPLIIE